MWNLHCEYTSQVFWCAVWVGGHSFKLAHLLGLHACFLDLVSFFYFLVILLFSVFVHVCLFCCISCASAGACVGIGPSQFS